MNNSLKIDDIRELIKYINDRNLTELYNKVGNKMYEDFGIHSAEAFLTTTYMINEFIDH